MDNDTYKRTRHLALPLYTDTTPLDLRDGYNEAMRTLDQEIHYLETLIRELEGSNQ